ncbi:hypothetical protein C427_0827 [Paraglaciecola psychrophila 170]|uniref:Uncharacterized protein n=1 Tax=Paraglaciecola psychrophila 170 TaxID=1129794 RepID=K6ZSR6_9ALTE|nr:hypothetical protein C427_0827 [Paraglaciecola psychrophila 170]GAC38976.1 hypothetical protein GPSY_3365 [Paraglaciecola psychrophila 170]
MQDTCGKEGWRGFTWIVTTLIYGAANLGWIDQFTYKDIQ